ncbi:MULTISPECIES: TetR/AcrR family transcriptional regulator [Bordetella]|uniref:TetR family transcriptional regulator n=2 Tax=Bordetella TaxID=517 RepID=A0A261VPM3_9BORD|nr:MULTISPECIES: TetR/AcrR family transcriptional regulator [Bordetella]MDM9557438.1 TetR/AcrR family transcriptional regulator [Bordetella petrii]OZI75999.1 TetR family transcriptional regulator [Bordetella genomosp. 2]
MNAAISTSRKLGRPARPASADGRDAMLDVATALFASQGVAATTIAHIAAGAGVTSAMVHYYFKNREQLIDVVVAERLAPVIAYVWAPAVAQAAAGDAAPADPHAMVARVVQRIVQCASERPWLAPLWMREVVNAGGQLRERVFRQLPFDHLHAFAAQIAQAQHAGAVNPHVEPRLVFLSVLGMTLVPLATADLWQRIWADDGAAAGLQPDTIATHAIAILSGGLLPPSSSTRRRPARRSPSRPGS